MGAVRIVFPKLDLGRLLRAPGGRAIVEMLVDADANLATLKPRSRDELLALLDAADAALADLGPDPKGLSLAELYRLAVRGIGAGAVCGCGHVDEALASLCDLIDAQQSGGRRDPEPLAIHLSAWRLLMDPDLPTTEAAVLLQGLRKVSGHYAQSVAP